MGGYIIRSGGRASGRTLRWYAEMDELIRAICSDDSINVKELEKKINASLPSNMAFRRYKSIEEELLENMPNNLKDIVKSCSKKPKVNIEDVELKKEKPAEAICTAGRKAIMREVGYDYIRTE